MRTIVNEVFFITSLSTKNTNDKYVIRRVLYTDWIIFPEDLIEREFGGVEAGAGRGGNGVRWWRFVISSIDNCRGEDLGVIGNRAGTVIVDKNG